MELEEPEHIWYAQHSVCSAFVKSVSFGGTAAISSCSVLEGWSNVGVVLAPGTEAAGCFWELLSPVHTAPSHTISEQPSPLLLPAYSDGWDELLYICSFFLIFSLLALGLNWQSEPQKFLLPFHPPFPLKFPLPEWAIVTDAFKLHCSLCKQRADIWHIFKLLYWILIIPVNRLCVCHTSAAENWWIIPAGTEGESPSFPSAGHGLEGWCPQGWSCEIGTVSTRVGGCTHSHKYLGVTMLVRITIG